MDKLEDIKVVLHFKAKDKIPADVVASIIYAVDLAILESELDDFETIKKEVPQIPQEFLDQVEKGMDYDQFKGLYLETAENGSIVLTGIVAAAATWILLNTIGESFKDAWKETELHQRIKDVLLSKQATKVRVLRNRIIRKVDESDHFANEDVNIKVSEHKQGDINVIRLLVLFSDEYPSTRGQLKFKDDAAPAESEMLMTE